MSIFYIFNFLIKHSIVPLFLFINLGIGVWAHRRAKVGSFEDYAMASRSLPVGVMVMTLLATIISNSDIMLVDRILRFGIVAPLLSLLARILFFVCIGTFIAPLLVFFRERTLSGVMAKLYGQEVGLISNCIAILVSLLALSTQISAIGVLSKALLGIDFATGVLFFGSIVVLYSIWGGMRAVSYTDVFQFVMALLVFCWLAQKSVVQEGGVFRLLEKLSVDHGDKLRFFNAPDFWISVKGNFFYVSVGIILTPPVIHRMLMVQDKKRVSNMWYTSAFVYVVLIGTTMLIGLYAICNKQALGVSKGSSGLAFVIQKVCAGQNLLIDFMSVCLICILVSTIDSFLFTTGIMMVGCAETVRGLLGKKGLEEHKKVGYAKIGILIVGILAIAFSMQFDMNLRSIAKKLIIPSGVIYAIVIIPFLLGVIGLKTDRTAWLSFSGTYLVSLYLHRGLIGIPKWGPKLAHRVYYDAFVVALPLGIIAFLITHIIRNRGIALVNRGEHYTMEYRWFPRWQSMYKRIKVIFNLPEQARVQLTRRPARSLTFSMCMLGLYMCESLLGGGSADFFAVIHWIGLILCVGLMLEGIWPIGLRQYFPMYWLGTLWYCLPFSATIVFLHVHAGLVNTLFFIGSFVIFSYLVTSNAFMGMSLFGIGIAHGGWYLLMGKLPSSLAQEAYIGGYVGVFVLMVSVVLFGRRLEAYLSEKLYVNKAFSHAMTHESKQPLMEISVLSGFQARMFDTLVPMQNKEGKKGFWLPESTQTSMQRGNEQIGKAVQEITQEFSRFSQLLGKEIGRMDQEKVSMNSLIQSIVPEFPRKQVKRIQVTVACTQDFEAILIRSLFANVLTNLLKNAYLHGGATRLDIRIDGNTRKVHVRDDGCGVPIEVLPHIFKLGFTTGSKINDGVGLALVKLILEASNIQIDCHTKRGEGSYTEFTLSFPDL